MGKEFEVEIKAKGGAGAAKEFAALGDSAKSATGEIKKLNTSAAEGVAPFDAVAAAQERLAARVKTSATVITTSTQQIIAQTRQLASSGIPNAAQAAENLAINAANRASMIPKAPPQAAGTFAGAAAGAGDGDGAAFGALTTGSIGLFVAGIAGAVKFAHAVHDASEELRKSGRAGAQAAQDIEDGIRTNAVGAITAASSHIRGLTNELDDLDHRWIGRKIWNGAKELVGIDGDGAKGEQLQKQKADLQRIQGDAVKQLVADMAKENEILDALIAGNTELAAQLERQAKISREDQHQHEQNKGLLDPQKMAANAAFVANQKKRTALEDKREAEEKITAEENRQQIEGERFAAWEQKQTAARERDRLAEYDAIEHKSHFDEQQREKQEKAAAHAAEQQRKEDERELQKREQWQKREQAARDELEVQRLIADGDKMHAQQLEIDRRASERIADIRREAPADMQAGLILLEKQTAELRKQEVAHEALAKHAQEQIAHKNEQIDRDIAHGKMNGQQRAEQIRANQDDARRERVAINHEVNRANQKRRDNGEAEMTQDERDNYAAAVGSARAAKRNGGAKNPAAIADALNNPDAAVQEPVARRHDVEIPKFEGKPQGIGNDIGDGIKAAAEAGTQAMKAAADALKQNLLRAAALLTEIDISGITDAIADLRSRIDSVRQNS